MRQYIALAIVLYSYDYILKRKLISFVTLVFIASLFHMSAIAFIPTYYICHKNMRIPILTLVFGVCLTLAFYFGDIIMEYIVVSEKYASIYLGEADAAGRGYSMLVLIVAIMALALVFKPHDLDDRKSVFYWIFFISVCATFCNNSIDGFEGNVVLAHLRNSLSAANYKQYQRQKYSLAFLHHS